MTGPVERVPLTDEQLEEWEADPGLHGHWANFLALVAELRASRAREQAQRTLREHAEHVKVELRAERDELQQRIDKALAVCDAATADHTAGTVGALVAEDVPSLTPRAVRAALTGTETTDA